MKILSVGVELFRADR